MLGERDVIDMEYEVDLILGKKRTRIKSERRSKKSQIEEEVEVLYRSCLGNCKYMCASTGHFEKQ